MPEFISTNMEKQMYLERQDVPEGLDIDDYRAEVIV